jgi:hypothetical protein
MIQTDIPLVATYHPESSEDYDLTATEKRLCGYVADAVLAHPFDYTDLYSALEKALEKYK